MSKQDVNRLIDEIELLSLDERIRVADSVLKTLTPVEQEVEDEWIAVAENRLQEIKMGKVSSIPGKVVFDEIQRRFSE